MRGVLIVVGVVAITLVGCGRNEPGTMGGEPGVPETVATGAPAEAAKQTSQTDSDKPALKSEQASSTFRSGGWMKAWGGAMVLYERRADCCGSGSDHFGRLRSQ